MESNEVNAGHGGCISMSKLHTF